MFVYKVTYVKNEPLLCELSPYPVRDGYTYQAYNGTLIYALVKANNPTEAKQVARKIVEEVKSAN